MSHLPIKNLKPIIIRLLNDYPTYRDDDRKIIAHIWMMQVGGIEKMMGISLYAFMKEYTSSSDYYSPEHITRLRRKVQEEMPHLRGEKYQQRKQMEQEVRSEFRK